MEIRRIEIQNYRGIRHLEWRIPKGKRFLCLIGPGDVGKTSILEAVYLALSERWSLSIADTDFFNADVTVPIIIRVALANLPKDILSHRILGMELSGIDESGEWHHDPEDGSEPCVIVQLTIDADLDPSWVAYRPDGSEPFISIGSGIRRKLSAFKLDERIDMHLRWSRSSALTKLTEQSHGASGMLANAMRVARQAVFSSITEEMSQLAKGVQDGLHRLGSGNFENLRPGLDSSVPSSGGLLALFENDVPLTNFGLGTRRLAGIATQEMGLGSQSILLVDEVEHGLEPHRLVYLLKYLKTTIRLSQVFVTTHSPIAVEQLDLTDLFVVRHSELGISVDQIPEGMNLGRALTRSRPSSFLARRILVVEGKTEHGLLLGLLDLWDSQRIKDKLAPSSALGVAVHDGQGGSNAPPRSKLFADIGYETGLFIDHDDKSIDKEVEAAEKAGVEIFRWTSGKCTEQEIVESSSAQDLAELLEVAKIFRVDAKTVVNDILAVDKDIEIVDLDVPGWLRSNNIDLDRARKAIHKAAVRYRWFKRVDNGLASWLYPRLTQLKGTTTGNLIEEIRLFLYGDVDSLSPGMSVVNSDG